MPANESVEYFLRFLNERFAVFRTALNCFLQSLALDDRSKKIETAKGVLTTLDDLKRAMSAEDRPSWIDSLEAKLQWYLRAVPGQPDAGFQVLQTVLAVHPEIESQTWNFADSSANAAIDFAAIYQEHYRESRVPDLFDELIAQLEEIVRSGEIDSLQAIKKLENLILTIRKNTRGDFFSTHCAWEFTKTFFKNYAFELVENLPGLKHVVKALRKTVSELDLEFSQVHDRIRQRLIDVVKGDLPLLQYKPLELSAPKNDGEDIDSLQAVARGAAGRAGLGLSNGDDGHVASAKRIHGSVTPAAGVFPARPERAT